MAATNYTPIQLYYSATAAAVPVNTNLVAGELAINITDGKLYYKNNAGTVTLLSSAAGASGDVVGPSSATANSIALFNSTTGKLIKDSSASDGLIYGLTVGRGAGAVVSNTAVGASALAANTTGYESVAVGSSALDSNTTGFQNTAVGQNALTANTTGTINVAVGTGALQSATTADGNTAVGSGVQLFTTTGAGNTSVGRIALFFNTTGGNNVAIGKEALFNNSTASNNTAVGYQAGYTTTSGTGNVFLGYQAGYTNQGGNDNTFVGNGAGYGGGQPNYGNVAVGIGAGGLLGAGGNYNTFLGVGAGGGVTTGGSNVIIGAYSGAAAPISATGSNYIVLSDGAGNLRAVFDTYGGFAFGGATTANNNSASFRAVQIKNNTATTILSSDYSSQLASNGYYDGSNWVRGGNSYAPVKYNQFNGAHTFSNAAAAGTTITWTDLAILNSDMLYAYVGVNPSSNGATNARIFNSSSGSGTVTLYVGNQTITTSSDVRLKENIVDTQRNALELLGQLRVVDHTWNDPSDQCENNRNSRGTWMGLIAQEAQPVIPWLVNKPTADIDENGDPQYWHMDYGYAVPLLVKAIQELKAEVDSLKAQLNGA
jgi:hypothetical protein